MSEPSLESISDYNTLKGEKKRVVIAVILSGLIMGTVYTIASIKYDNSEDNLIVKEKLNNIQMK